MLVILTPQGMTDPTEIAEQLKPYAKALGKPVLASWMGGVGRRSGRGDSEPGRHSRPSRIPDTAARAFNYMWRYAYNLQGPVRNAAMLAASEESGPDRAKAAEIIQAVRKTGRTILTEYESKKLLDSLRHPDRATRDRARRATRRWRWPTRSAIPVVLKLYSETITHKTDVGGVLLNLRDAKTRCAGLQRHPGRGDARRRAPSTSRA